MTINTDALSAAPELRIDYNSLVHRKAVVDSNIALLDLHLRNLTRQREQLLRQRTTLLKEAEKWQKFKSPLVRLPFESLARFLRAVDVCNFSASSRVFHEKCKEDNNKLLLIHFVTPERGISTVHEARSFIDSLRVEMVETMDIDAKKQSGRLIMEALASKGGAFFTSLVSVRISAAAQTGSFLKSLFIFMSHLPHNKLESLHLSGFLTIRHVAILTWNQAESLEHFQVDYFVNGHEPEILPEYLPPMPNLRSLIYDVADVCEISADLVIDRLSQITRKDLVTSIYLPHVQILGETNKIQQLVNLIKEFSNVDQIVVRFRHLPLSVGEIVRLREAFAKLPACCISDHFIVVQRHWCSWWPALPDVWDAPDRITGLSVFREQIDFDSLGTSATREWLKLSTEQKELWSTTIASRVIELYLDAPQRRTTMRAASGNSAIRASSV